MTYPSKKSPWLHVLVILLCIVLFGAAGILAGAAFYAKQPLLFLPAFVVGAVGAMLVWAMTSTYYEITETDLRIHFGPLRWSIPLETITDVYSTRRVVLKPAWGLAWSLDHLMIKRRDRFLVYGISPSDKAEFIAELSRARPGLNVIEI